MPPLDQIAEQAEVFDRQLRWGSLTEHDVAFASPASSMRIGVGSDDDVVNAFSVDVPLPRSRTGSNCHLAGCR